MSWGLPVELSLLYKIGLNEQFIKSALNKMAFNINCFLVLQPINSFKQKIVKFDRTFSAVTLSLSVILSSQFYQSSSHNEHKESFEYGWISLVLNELARFQ